MGKTKQIESLNPQKTIELRDIENLQSTAEYNHHVALKEIGIDTEDDLTDMPDNG